MILSTLDTRCRYPP